jgi:hypothetical protein
VWVDPTCDQPLQYLHWAGIRIEPGCPYWEIWAESRYAGEVMPEFEVAPQRGPTFKQGVKQLLTNLRG